MTEVYHAAQFPISKCCSQCHIEKPIDAFHKDNSQKSGYRSACKECIFFRKKLPQRIVQKPLFVTSRICTKCHIEKPLEEFSLQKKGPHGRRPYCKACQSAEHKRNYKPIKPPLPPVVNGGKICRKCLIEKPLEQFGSDKRASDGKGTQCKTCVHFREQVLNHDRSLARTRKHWEKNGEQYRAQHAQWKRENALKITEINRRRDARKKAATIGEVDYERILERDSMWCHICEQDILPHQKVNFDHVIPLDRGGAHSEENIHVAHKTCNLRKGTKLLSEMTSYLRRGVN